MESRRMSFARDVESAPSMILVGRGYQVRRCSVSTKRLKETVTTLTDMGRSDQAQKFEEQPIKEV